MVGEQPDLEWQTKEKLRRFLSARFRVRLHVSVLLLTAIAVGWIANRTLFFLGVERLLSRTWSRHRGVLRFSRRCFGLDSIVGHPGVHEVEEVEGNAGRSRASGGPPDPAPWYVLGNIDPSFAAVGGEGCLVVFLVLVLLAPSSVSAGISSRTPLRFLRK